MFLCASCPLVNPTTEGHRARPSPATIVPGTAMDFVLNEIEARVLGALMEKEITTPDYYPLSLNSLVNACNQKNNREPVMNLEESSVREALDSLQSKRLAGPASGADSRVAKYEHRSAEVFNFTRGEAGVICVLLLRGPQTPGELRGRTERMHRFDGLDEVHSTLQRLTQRDPSLVKMLPRQPGTKESRYVHLLSGDVPDVVPERAGDASGPIADRGDGSPSLQEDIAALRNELAELKAEFEDFKKRFE